MLSSTLGSVRLSYFPRRIFVFWLTALEVSSRIRGGMWEAGKCEKCENFEFSVFVGLDVVGLLLV